MYILTSNLVALPGVHQSRTSGAKLPLPWYHRAPLGLMSGMPVHVALQASRQRPFGDLLVSVVDPANWPYVFEISASRADKPGVLADLYRLVSPLNIVFAEAVTVDSGSRHDVRLVVEPFYLDPDQPNLDELMGTQLDRIKTELEKINFYNVGQRNLFSDQPELVWMEVGQVELGWVQVEGWREALLGQSSQGTAADFDLEKAVVSADTDRRFLRYVFPRRGAVSITVQHYDQPGALGKIAGALAGGDLNVLSSLLRRGSVPPFKAEVVLVVEPSNGAASIDDLPRLARAALDGLPPTLRLRVHVSEAAPPVLYPRRPDEIAVRPSRVLEAIIRAVRETLPPPEEKQPIFISRRFLDLANDGVDHEAVELLRKVLDDYGFVAVEARPQPGGEFAVSDEVKAKMWACKAAIVLVVSAPGKDGEFSENLAHELGFMQGQGKPLLPLVEESAEKRLKEIANLQGLQLTTFNRTHAADRTHPRSIYAVVGEWRKLMQPLLTDQAWPTKPSASSMASPL